VDPAVRYLSANRSYEGYSVFVGGSLFIVMMILMTHRQHYLI
jgi:hypothetical protein